MTPCANGHAPILHDEFHCPLCAALEDADGYEDAVQQAEDTILALEEHIATLDLSDVLHAQASEAEALERAYKAELRVRQLEWGIRESERYRTLTTKLNHIYETLRIPA